MSAASPAYFEIIDFMSFGLPEDYCVRFRRPASRGFGRGSDEQGERYDA